MLEVYDIALKMGLMMPATLKFPSRPPTFRAMYKILRNPFYYGVFNHKGEIKQGNYEPLITKSLFDKVQAVLDDRGYKHTRKFIYLFSGLLTCFHCGRPLRAISAKKRYKYYSCRNLACKCNLKEEMVEEYFTKDLQDLEFDDNEAKQFLKAVTIFRQDLKSNRETQIKHVDLELTKLRQEKDRLLDLCLAGTVSEDAYKSKSSELVNKDKDLCERRMALEKADSNVLDHIAEIGKLLKKPSLAYRMASEEKRRKLVKSLVENLSWKTVEGVKTITVVWKNEFQPVADRNKLNSGGPSENRTRVSTMRM